MKFKVMGLYQFYFVYVILIWLSIGLNRDTTAFISINDIYSIIQ